MAAEGSACHDEMVPPTMQRIAPAVVFTPGEEGVIYRARERLGSLVEDVSFGRIGEVLGSILPVAGAMILTVRAGNPAGMSCTLDGIPARLLEAAFATAEDDAVMAVGCHIRPGVCVRAVDLVREEGGLARTAFLQAHRRHRGFGSWLALKLGERRGIGGVSHDCLLLFGGASESAPTSREARMLEAIHGDLSACLGRAGLPVHAHEPMAFQLLEENESGYAFLRRDGTVFLANRRLHQYLRSVGVALKELSREAVGRGWGIGAGSHTSRVGGLDYCLHRLPRGSHAVSEDLFLVEVPVPRWGGFPRGLTQRQRDVAMLMVTTGQSQKELAEQLGISPGTVRKHVEQVFRVCGVHSRSELCAKYGHARRD